MRHRETTEEGSQTRALCQGGALLASNTRDAQGTEDGNDNITRVSHHSSPWHGCNTHDS
jgi:hypothetical protein